MKYCLYLILFILTGKVSAQVEELLSKIEIENKIYSGNIHTPLLYKGEDPLSSPVIRLNSGEYFRLRFDDFSMEMNNYKYTFIHCSHDWKVSDIMVNDYLDGFEATDLLDYEFSFNTYQPYIHYSTAFPNDQVNLRLSGNYLLVVFDEQDEVIPLFTQRFSIFEEDLVKLYPNLHIARLPRNRDTHHEIDVELDYTDFTVYNPMEEFHLVLQQNGRWDNAIRDLKPNRFKTEYLVYDYEKENSFPAGNEFREFSIKSLQTYGIHVKRIGRKDSIFRVKLMHDGERDKAYYTFNFDINGKKQIHVVNRNNPHTEGDYAFVNFTLASPFGEMNGDIYVVGDLNHWQLDESNRMEYRPRTNSYRSIMLLKQGYYNYQYLFVPEGDVAGITETFEGDYFQANNEYQVYLYHSNQSLLYDRLIAIKFLEINAF